MSSPESAEAVRLLEEALQGDLERCRTALVEGERETGLSSLESAFAKLDTALDLIRSTVRRDGRR
jgi:hypothetical protein